MRTRLLVLVVTIAGALSIATTAAPTRDARDVTVLERWTRAVTAHAPGRVDDPLVSVATLTYDDRRRLNDALDAFFDALVRGRASTSTTDEARAAQLGAEAARAPGANAFLARAAVLHADAVIFAARLPSPPADPRDASSETTLVSASDGEYEGLTRASWHWKFAGDLLDHIAPRPAADPFVARWYHAVAAYLFSGSRYGEASPLLRRAAVLLPNDPRLLFDQACLSETVGSPHVQAVLNDPRAQAGAATQDLQPSRTSSQSSTRVVTVSEREANSEAERLFRRALAIDGSLVEARVRLGRLLLVRGRDADAAAELAKAIAQSREPAVSYLAHLFAARADERLGKLDDAAAHADAALALFPDAQSALIAKSHVALQRADAAGALDPIRRLPRVVEARPPRDPWSEYYLGAGRNSTTLLADLWSSIGR